MLNETEKKNCQKNITIHSRTSKCNNYSMENLCKDFTAQLRRITER